MRNYDKRVKQTRIFLDEYYVVRGISRQAGISMAEALHRLLVGRIPEAEPMTKPLTILPAFKVPVAQVALRYSSQPAIVTNGSRVPALGIKSKGVRYD
ncbi:hypothetical protein ES703_121851 [subsurface metagenome]